MLLRLVLCTVLLLPSATWACEIQALFSPQDDIESAIVAVLYGATTTIDCSLFGISNPRLAKALTERAQHGVKVRVGLDQRQSKLSGDLHGALSLGGVKVAIKKKAILEHSKYCQVDAETVIMGSWNWSRRAKYQDNSDVILTGCPDVAAAFRKNFDMIWQRDTKG